MNTDEYLQWLLNYINNPSGLQHELREICKACKSVGLEEHSVDAVCYYLNLTYEKHKNILSSIPIQ